MSNIKVSVEAVVERGSGEVECTVRCKGQQAKVVFTGKEVYIDVPQKGDAG
jgi:hypothetical protein